jgi:PKD repeat protein
MKTPSLRKKLVFLAIASIVFIILILCTSSVERVSAAPDNSPPENIGKAATELSQVSENLREALTNIKNAGTALKRAGENLKSAGNNLTMGVENVRLQGENLQLAAENLKGAGIALETEPENLLLVGAQLRAAETYIALAGALKDNIAASLTNGRENLAADNLAKISNYDKLDNVARLIENGNFHLAGDNLYSAGTDFVSAGTEYASYTGSGSGFVASAGVTIRDSVGPLLQQAAENLRRAMLALENVNIPPTAAFTYSPTSPTTDNTIQFTDQSTDNDGTIVSWHWNFGNGTTSTLKNPTRKYSNPNTYAVVLTVTDNGGASDAENKLITVTSVMPKVPTSLSISPSSFTIQNGSSTTLTATLKDNANNPLANKTISWSKTAGSLSATSGTTNSSGQVSVTYTAPTVTTQTSVTVTASFAGDNQYQASTGYSYGTITVENENVKTSTTLSVSPLSFTLSPGGTKTLTATLKDNANNPLANKTMTWFAGLGNISPGSGTTNSAGQVSVTYTAPITAVNLLDNILATFTGDNQYQASFGYSFGTITAENENVKTSTALSITPSSFTLYPGENKTFIATLRVENNNALANKTITWNATAGTFSTSISTTNSSGWTSVTYTAPHVTAQISVTVTAYFMSDSQYQSSYDSSYGTILPQPVAQSTSLSVFPPYFTLFPGYSGQVQSLIATLRDSNNNPIPNKTITCSATSGSINPSSGTTNALGQFSAVYTAPTVTAETSATITMSFAGDDQYGPRSTTSSGIPATPVIQNIPASTGGAVVINVIGTNVTINVLAVPPNSLHEDTSITVRQMPPENMAAHTMMSNIFDIGPNGISFTTPVTLTLPYQLQAGVSEDNLAIYYYNTDTNSWERVGGNVNKVDKTVSVQIDHLSKYAVMAELAAAPQVGGGIPLIAVILAVLGVSAAAAASSAWIYLRRTRGEATSKLIEHGLSSMSLQEADIFREIREQKKFSIPELMSQTGASKTIVWRTVQKLIKKGLVQPTEGVKAPAAGRGKPSTVYKYVGD